MHVFLGITGASGAPYAARLLEALAAADCEIGICASGAGIEVLATELFGDPALPRDETLARLLMECSFCQRREVVYLNEMQLKSFEVRRCVARHCRHCDSPSIWVESLSEGPGAEGDGARFTEERVVPRRNRTRVRARVLACIRRRGFAEEVVVCEDLSKGGISFRSRNQYPEGTRVEVAVPFTPGTGAIFVPIRIVFSQAIPTAGLHRHGAAYIKSPIDN